MTKKECVCCICDKPILEKDPFPCGEGKYRHRRGCGPGSKAWTAKYGLSEIGAMLQKKAKPPMEKTKKVAKDPLLCAIKEFAGRVKYMVYMDTVNKNIECDWQVSAVIGGKKITHHKYQGTIDPDILYRQFLTGITHPMKGGK